MSDKTFDILTGQMDALGKAISEATTARGELEFHLRAAESEQVSLEVLVDVAIKAMAACQQEGTFDQPPEFDDLVKTYLEGGRSGR